MKSGILDYLKCVKANKFTLAGYLSLAGFLSLPILPIKDEGLLFFGMFIIGFSSVIMLSVTELGYETFSSYRRTKEFLRTHEPDRRFGERYQNTYCNRAGYNLAMKESKLEKLN